MMCAIRYGPLAMRTPQVPAPWSEHGKDNDDRMNADRLVAEWHSVSGKYFVRLEQSPDGFYSYSHFYGAGMLGNLVTTDTAAINILQNDIERMLYQPDAHKTPMRRVF